MGKTRLFLKLCHYLKTNNRDSGVETFLKKILMDQLTCYSQEKIKPTDYLQSLVLFLQP